MNHTRISKVLELVKKAHAGQQRKYTFEPYWEHPKAVADKYLEYKPDDEIGYVVALLHDVLEDTSMKLTVDMFKSIGYSQREATSILFGVWELTDEFTKENYPTMNRRTRKGLEALRLSKISSRSQTIKYCDLMDNTVSIADNDPTFSKTYLREKSELLNLMVLGDPKAYSDCLDVLKKCYERVES